MNAVEVVGGGAVAQLLCRDLQAAGGSVRLHVPQRGLNAHQQRQRLAGLAALPWLQGVALSGKPGQDSEGDVEPETLRIFAGTPEQWFDYQNSSGHQSACSPVMLLTSWWDSLSALQQQLRGPVVPVYPRITVESWQGRLAVLGQLKLEIPSDSLAVDLDQTSLRGCLNQLGLDWEERPMQARFKALFARTSFAYWYLVTCLEPRRRGEPGADKETITAQWQRTELLVSGEADLQVPLGMLEMVLSMMRNGDPECSDAAWILNVLVEHKRAKIDYFLERQGSLR
jgi:hypothetical protein